MIVDVMTNVLLEKETDFRIDNTPTKIYLCDYSLP